jgi:histidine triad (HIT) family protein
MGDFYCDCVLNGSAEVDVLVDTPNILAFRHTRPYWHVHIVVIPKMHIDSIDTVGPAEDSILVEALRVIAKLAAQIRAEHGGCRISTNVGDDQSTKHLHWYIHAGERFRDKSGAPLVAR